MAIGLALARTLNRRLEFLMFGVSPQDAWMLGLAISVLFVAAAAACCMPAIGAACIDPAHTLRAD